MYLGIDIGGTKTLIATLDDQGQILEQTKFPTSKDYAQFLNDLEQNLQSLEIDPEARACACIPGLIDRKKGIVYSLGNLPWRNMPIRQDLSRVAGRPVLIENDARLAGLSEALLVSDEYETVLYATISTGIGGGLIQNGHIVRAMEDLEMGKMPLWHEGKFQHWEDFAGGHALSLRLGKLASEITDPADWQELAELLAQGFGPACAIMQPDAIILGGGVGKQADHYSKQLLEIIIQQAHSNVQPPKVILCAQRPEEAGVYGCYEFAKQHYDAAN